MNRRSLLKMFSALPFVGVTSIAEPFAYAYPAELNQGVAVNKVVRGVVTLVNYYPAFHEEELRTFDTPAEAHAWVQGLMPRIETVYFSACGEDNIIRSGYRGAIRAVLSERIDQTLFSIVDADKNVVFKHWNGCVIFNADYAWSLISNIRVNREPVNLNSANGLPKVLLVPFDKGNPKAIRTLHHIDGSRHEAHFDDQAMLKPTYTNYFPL